jgi:hypothetical protein
MYEITIELEEIVKVANSMAQLCLSESRIMKLRMTKSSTQDDEAKSQPVKSKEDTDV